MAANKLSILILLVLVANLALSELRYRHVLRTLEYLLESEKLWTVVFKIRDKMEALAKLAGNGTKKS